jgi:hypothetical protein
MGVEARRRVNDRLNFPRMMRQYEARYLDWLREKRSGAAGSAVSQLS